MSLPWVADRANPPSDWNGGVRGVPFVSHVYPLAPVAVKTRVVPTQAEVSRVETFNSGFKPMVTTTVSTTWQEIPPLFLVTVTK